MTALTRLRLTDFRSHASLDLKLDARPVCLWGSNGAGKTNVLEAISQLGPGRGLRAAALPEMTRHGASSGWTISAVLDEDRKLGVGLDSTGNGNKRVVRLDGAPATATDLADLIRIVWLTPAMDSVFRGGATERRRFFDRQVMAHIPSHGSVSNRYEKAMRERNALLERGRVDPAWADAIEGRMAEAGAIIASNRARILIALQDAINDRPEGFFPKGDLALEGDAEKLASEDSSLFDVQDLIAEQLAKGRYRDQAAGRHAVWPASNRSIRHSSANGCSRRRCIDGPTKGAADWTDPGQRARAQCRWQWPKPSDPLGRSRGAFRSRSTCGIVR